MNKNAVAGEPQSQVEENALLSLIQSSKSDKIVQDAELLIARGIDINYKDGNGNNALTVLCSSSQNENCTPILRSCHSEVYYYLAGMCCFNRVFFCLWNHEGGKGESLCTLHITPPIEGGTECYKTLL